MIVLMFISSMLVVFGLSVFEWLIWCLSSWWWIWLIMLWFVRLVGLLIISRLWIWEGL